MIHHPKGFQHKAHNGLRFHGPGIIQKAGHLPPAQGGIQRAFPGLLPSQNHGDLPPAVALFHDQTANPGSHILRLLIDMPGLHQSHPAAVPLRALFLPAEQLGFHLFQCRDGKPMPLGQVDRRGNLHTLFPGHPGKLGRCAADRGEHPVLHHIQGAGAVGANGHIHLFCLAENTPQNFQLLGGKALKRIHRHSISGEKPVFPQAIPQPGQIVQRIQIALGHQRIIGGEHPGDVRRLFPQGLLPGAQGGLAQGFRGNGAHFQLRRGLQEQLNHLAALGLGPKQGQGIGHFLQGQAHEDGAPAVIQAAASHAAHLPEHSIRQPGEAENLHPLGLPGAKTTEHGSLALKGVLFRRQQKEVSFPVFAPSGQQLSDILGLAAAGPSVNYMQHPAPSFPM